MTRQFAAMMTTSIGQLVAAVVTLDAVTGRLKLGPVGLVQWHRTYWGEPKDLRWLEHELRACGIEPISCHPLGPDACPPGHWRSVGDACEQATMTVLAYAAWSWGVENSLDPAPWPAGTMLQ